MLTSNTPGAAGLDNNHVRFLLNGAVKTLSRPVTGAALHLIAGNPAYLVSDGKDVPNDYEPFDLKHDQQVYTKPEKDERKGPPVMDSTTFRKE